MVGSDIVVCIGTKNRKKTRTYKLFEGLFPVHHFIEPQEYKEYEVPNKVSIDKNDQGISYMRNYVMDWSKNNNYKWVIISDDDIQNFGIVKDGKSITTGAEIWEDIYLKAQKLPFELYGINYCQFAWSEKNRYSINSKFVDCCVMLDLENISWDFGDWKLKSDRNFTLKTIKNGHGVMRFNKYWFRCPNVGSNKGGLFDLYKNKTDAVYAERLHKEWRPYTRLIKKSGRIDTKVDIKGIANYYNKKVNEIA
jgi:hypothetical protein